MKPATSPREDPRADRLLVISRTGERTTETTIAHFAKAFREGDLLVVNDAATLPASFRTPFGELRLLEAPLDGTARAVLFDEADWHTPTEAREAPRLFPTGSSFLLNRTMAVEVTDVSSISPRLITIRFVATRAALWNFIFEFGEPVQYSYLKARLRLWDIETPFATRPWAVEMPCAGRTLVSTVQAQLQEHGVNLATLTHGAGLSATGDEAIDQALPLSERYEIPESTVRAIAETKNRGSRVVAIGTTVTRALEGAALLGPLHAGSGVTDYKLGPESELRIVDGILTGVHELGTSHYELMRAFASSEILDHAVQVAEANGFLTHEFGDSFLLI